MATTDKAGPRPAGLSPQAAWPPKVRTEPFVTVAADIGPEGGVSVRVGPRAILAGPKATATPMVASATVSGETGTTTTGRRGARKAASRAAKKAAR